MSLKDFVLEQIFVVSKKPVLFRDLLEANCTYNENMLIDPSKLNFRFRYLKTYLVYGVICAIFLIILLGITHAFFAKEDIHLSILGTIMATSAVFVGFDLFKIWARKSISLRLIKKAWEIHFPYFPYEKYKVKLEEIYNSALKHEIPKKELEQYVMIALTKESV